MGKPKVLVTRRVPTEGLDILREKCDVDLWDNDDVMPRKSLLERVKGVEGLFCTINDKIDAEVLDAAGRCEQPFLKSLTLHKIMCASCMFYLYRGKFQTSNRKLSE